jgi:glutamate/tyrosine decarboxylase-like PLP-dependent enzyme
MTRACDNKSDLSLMRMDALLEQSRGYARDYIATVNHRRVNPDQAALARLAEFDEPLPAAATDPSEMLRQLHELGSPTTMASTGGRYFGLVNGGAHPPAVATKWLTDAWDQNAAFFVTSPIASKLEAVSERWLVDLLGLPSQTVAGFVGGTSTALTAGFVTARNELLARQGWDAASRGLFDAPGIRVVLGEHAHGSVLKALAFVGLGKDRVELAPADDQGRIIPERMPALDDRTLVVAQAGNVNSGAFDPLDAICNLAQKANAWVHVDGAFGLWAAASRSKRAFVNGMDQADSWAADAHKTLNAPYDCGIILCKHPDKLARAMQASGSYLQTTPGERDGSDFAPEMSRRARAIELWATLKTLGRAGVEHLVDQLCERARSIAEGLRAQRFQIENDVVFNQVLVSCETPEVTRSTVSNIQEDGEVWCGGAIWHSRPVIRVSVCSWATTAADVERTVAAFCAARDRALSSPRIARS